MNNDNDERTTVTSGISFCGLLGIVFITLKLLHVIEWSWVWVLAPLWLPTVFVIGILACLVICVLITDTIHDR